jgi:hypothetical protein
MTTPTTKDAQDAERAAQGSETSEETLECKNVPLPAIPEENMTKGRKIAISTVLVFCNSLLVSDVGHWKVHKLIDNSSSSLLALA